MRGTFAPYVQAGGKWGRLSYAIGSCTGTILGALILIVLNSMLTFINVGQAIQQVVHGAIVLLLA